MKILLASASPRRKELIHIITDDVRILPADCDETVPDGFSAQKTVEYLSAIKGKAVLPDAKDGEIIVSADTVVALDGKILGKPHSADEAFGMLSLLSGRTHTVYTGVTLLTAKKADTFFVSTDVTFYELSHEEINAYIKTGEPFDKAGAYGIQKYGAVLVKSIDGDYFNVVGLPVATLKRRLSAFINSD